MFICEPSGLFFSFINSRRNVNIDRCIWNITVWISFTQWWSWIKLLIIMLSSLPLWLNTWTQTDLSSLNLIELGEKSSIRKIMEFLSSFHSFLNRRLNITFEFLWSTFDRYIKGVIFSKAALLVSLKLSSRRIYTSIKFRNLVSTFNR
jgi:hypothetical protein